ncbi:glutamate receptor 2.7 [Phtheirospermum japonicum]|uniref:Glutamate receptor n=1 Tax=Phtheirospermum japonicum TaxID=374723 RepID=A0A830C3A7_9LAMI|nr:glutamate receptor 2.7 [Phtheirospermum japonicum]
MNFLKYFFFCCSLLSLIESKASKISQECPKEPIRIGVVVDERFRVGKEQKIAMEMAVQDFKSCVNMILYTSRAASASIDLVSHNQVDAIIGTVTMQEATLLSEISTSTKIIPIISLSPTASAPQQIAPKFPSFIQMNIPVTYHIQCISAMVARFKWRKVILLNEQVNGLSDDPGLLTRLSDSIRAVDSYVERHVSFPQFSSLLDPKAFIGDELKRLRSKNVKVFVVLQCSLDFAAILFEKAKGLGMLGKGYVWIVSDEIANLLDSIDLSVIRNMQGVVGLKTDYADDKDYLRDFKTKFRRKYGSEYPNEEENTNPSIYAFRAYDAIWSLVKALQNGSNELTKSILSSVDFEGLSGRISFKNGLLSQKPVFRIVNLIGKSYQEVAIWSPEFGFSEELDGKRMSLNGGDLTGELSSVYWPGGERTVPAGLSMGSKEKPLRVGVPAKGAFKQFVKVTADPVTNQTRIGGFSIEVFVAAVKELPYDFHYVFVPYYGSYDEMVVAVSNKSLDAAVGDTEIMADRYVYVSFSHPYIESGLVMVVTVKPGLQDSSIIALKPFTMKMWVLLAIFCLLTGAITWFSEYANGNTEFTGKPFLDHIISILWLSVTIISFSQTWKCVVFVVAASFTAVLSTMMTVPRLQPSIQEIDYLRKTNATVGCNGNSFICRYLISVLNFEPGNVRGINSIDEYPLAFERGEIKAAFFVVPHAKVFLKKYCKGYIRSGPSYTLGGFGFVFSKGSPLEADMSEAILKVTQSGEVNKLETNMLQLCNCSSSTGRQDTDDLTLGPGPFSYMFWVLFGTIAVAFVISIFRLVWQRIEPVFRLVYVSIQRALLMNRVCMWASSVLAVAHHQTKPNMVDTQTKPGQQ